MYIFVQEDSKVTKLPWWSVEALSRIVMTLCCIIRYWDQLGYMTLLVRSLIWWINPVRASFVISWDWCSWVDNIGVFFWQRVQILLWKDLEFDAGLKKFVGALIGLLIGAAFNRIFSRPQLYTSFRIFSRCIRHTQWGWNLISLLNGHGWNDASTFLMRC